MHRKIIIAIRRRELEHLASRDSLEAETQKQKFRHMFFFFLQIEQLAELEHGGGSYVPASLAPNHQ